MLERGVGRQEEPARCLLAAAAGWLGSVAPSWRQGAVLGASRSSLQGAGPQRPESPMRAGD